MSRTDLNLLRAALFHHGRVTSSGRPPCHGDRGNRGGPASVKCEVSDGLDHLVLCHAMIARSGEVRAKLSGRFIAINALTVTRLRSRLDGQDVPTRP